MGTSVHEASPVVAGKQPRLRKKNLRGSDDFDEEAGRRGTDDVIVLIPAEGEVEWEWCPWPWLNCLNCFNCTKTRCVRTSSIIGLFIGTILFLFGLFGNAAALAFGIIFMLWSLFGLYYSAVIIWNMGKQSAYDLARAKQKQASRLWDDIDPQFKHIEKDEFFKAKYGGKRTGAELKVLRDGTIEKHEVAGGDGDDGDDLLKSAMKSVASAVGEGE